MLERGIARPQENELPAAVQPSSHRGRGDVEALLLDQPRDHSQKRHSRIGFQTRFLLERGLVSRAARECRGREVAGDVRVRRRVPGIDVDAIQDPRQPVLPLPQDPVEPEASGARQDLARVGRADGREHVRAQDAQTHQRIAERLRQDLERAGTPQLVISQEPTRPLGGVGEVVDREDGGHVAKVRVLASFGGEPPDRRSCANRERARRRASSASPRRTRARRARKR